MNYYLIYPSLTYGENDCKSFGKAELSNLDTYKYFDATFYQPAIRGEKVIESFACPDFKVKANKKLPDVTYGNHINTRKFWLCSMKFTRILENSIASQFQKFNAILVYRKKEFEYFLISFFYEFIDSIDFKESEFLLDKNTSLYEKGKQPLPLEKINFNTYKEYAKAQKKENGFEVRINKLKLKSNLKVDFFRLGNMFFCSHEFLLLMIEKNITGIKVSKAPKGNNLFSMDWNIIKQNEVSIL